jgi:hypothetical protein
MDDSQSQKNRHADSDWLKQQVAFHGDVLPFQLLLNEFIFDGSIDHLLGAQGIRRLKDILREIDGPMLKH